MQIAREITHPNAHSLIFPKRNGKINLYYEFTYGKGFIYADPKRKPLPAQQKMRRLPAAEP
jgi:hypothetical protein